MKTRPLSSSEAAEFLNTTMGTLANWRHNGQGPAYIKLRRKILYDREDLERWLERQKVKTADDSDI